MLLLKVKNVRALIFRKYAHGRIMSLCQCEELLKIIIVHIISNRVATS